jgi:hypothetical protein
MLGERVYQILIGARSYWMKLGTDPFDAAFKACIVKATISCPSACRMRTIPSIVDVAGPK